MGQNLAQLFLLQDVRRKLLNTLKKVTNRNKIHPTTGEKISSVHRQKIKIAVKLLRKKPLTH
jgi:hypothetical protein